jgi:hypothetical protein
MPIDNELTTKIYNRYAWLRDHGHQDFINKHDKCERFFAGDQWDRADKARLALLRRPALTINKILSTMSNIMGEQIFNRSEISFRPRNGAPSEIAEILTKVFKQISDNNQLDWKRSDMFADGIIGSRGYLDVRLSHNDSMQGEVKIENLNPKNVLPDADADSYDPDDWSEVFTTKWLTADDIAVLYGEENAALLRNRDQSTFLYGYDSIDVDRDRFGIPYGASTSTEAWDSSVSRNIRIIERQYRQLDRQKHFVMPSTGEMRAIPEAFDRNKIALYVQTYGFQVITKLVRRIRWCVIADNVRLHDDWSPYKHFTVVPFFPHFRRGNTIGLVENLLDPQELLNKTSSQELHVINTSANSGWKVKTGSLTNMTTEELEEKGAMTGLVIETNDDVDKSIQKIQPNTIPTGLDRVGFKAEENIKSISGVSDSMQGFDREDVAAKAIQAKRQAGSTNLVKPMDSLVRSDYILARNTLDLVQEFYTEERLLSITHDTLNAETETFSINKADAYGRIVNDLTVGEYSVVVSNVPKRETLEDSQFEQAVAMREMGVPIPDSVLIDNSRLNNKADILKQMQGDQTSPEAQAQKALEQRAAAAEVAKVEGEAANKAADAELKKTKADKTVVETQVLANTPPEQADGQGQLALEAEKAGAEIDLEERRFQHEKEMDMMKMRHNRELAQDKLALQAQQQAQQAAQQRAQAQQQAAAAAQKPAPAQK